MRFDSLTLALEPWFEHRLDSVPVEVRDRIEKDFSPMGWDDLEPDERRKIARLHDYQSDLDAQDAEYWWNLGQEIDDLQVKISEWENIPTTTATELGHKEARLQELRSRVLLLQQRERNGRGVYMPPSARFKAESWEDFVSYPRAMEMLRTRLGATPGEFAMWVWFGGRQNGLEAYKKQSEGFPPGRFLFHPQLDPDYNKAMVGCWFILEELEAFEPKDRYIAGSELVARWQSILGDQVRAFIIAKVEESRLIDLHPVWGGTQASAPEDLELPSLEEGLFPLAGVEEVEAVELASISARPEKVLEVGSSEWRSENARRAAQARHARPGGSNYKRDKIRRIWATGKYRTRDLCAEEECRALGLSFDAARDHLNNTPDPDPWPGRC